MQETVNNVGIDMFKLVEFLETFLPIVDSKIPTCINEGGCGIFAKHLSNALKTLGVPSKVVFIGDKTEKEEMEYLLNNRAFRNKCGTKHCLVSISEYIYFDSSGIFHHPKFGTESKRSDSYYGEITEDVLDLLIARKDCWNPTFDRKCEEQIEQLLSELKHQFELFCQDKFDMEFTDGLRLSPHTIKYRRGGGLFGMF